MTNERDSANGGAVPESRQELQYAASEIYYLLCGLRGMIWSAHYSEENSYTQDASVALLPITEVVLSMSKELAESLEKIRA